MSKILVADSGSSKTDWLLGEHNQPAIPYKTGGLNPYFLSEKEIIKIVQDQAADMTAHAGDIDEIYFFGAGCSSPDRHEIISNALSHIFPKTFISVDSDLLGSAYATCGHAQGFCCVLGTGSNISFFDGHRVHDGKHGLGFVLGDEGSGTWFGKTLVTDYLYGKMPDDTAALFGDTYRLTKDIIITQVYQKQGANSYLAGFARFLNQIKDTAYGNQLIEGGLSEFIETNIKSYPDYKHYACNFVGSIAWFLSDKLRQLCHDQQISVGKIIQQPVNDLLEFILAKG